MASAETTSWRVILGAAAGSSGEREEFARRYAPVIRTYLNARWRNQPLLAEIGDSVQEVFVECFREGGVLAKADPKRPGGFRPFFYGVLRNVALRYEQRAGRQAVAPADSSVEWDALPGRGDPLSAVFDRAWAYAVMKEAAARQAAAAQVKGEAALRRVELLRLRFQENLPIRTIAARWQMDAADLHHEYATARKEFEVALYQVVAEHHPGEPEAMERTLREILTSLG